MRIISASDLARNRSAILERILTGETVSVMRNRTEVAQIVPAKRSMTAAQAIAGLEGKLRARANPANTIASCLLSNGRIVIA